MPVRLDRDERRARLAEAVWQIVARDGVRAASVRGVAREAGLAMGSVRHVFSTQDELLRFAVTELGEQVRRRIEAGRPSRAAAVAEGRPMDAAVALFEELLPLDARRWTEARVWEAFTAAPITDEPMADIRRTADEGIRELCRSVLVGLAERGLLHPDRDVEVETERVHALVDGLTIHLLVDRARISLGRVRSVVAVHLQDLRAAPM